MLEFENVQLEFPGDANIVVGQTHFIKSVEDIYEAIVNSVPQAKFGVAFNEASGPCLVRAEGNDEELKQVALRMAQAVGAGHTFYVVVRQAFPINLTNAIQNVPEVCCLYCATANPVQVIVAKSGQGRGIMGVIDGSSPKGVEGPQDMETRRGFLRKIGYKI